MSGSSRPFCAGRGQEVPKVSEYDRAFARVTVSLGLLSKGKVKDCVEAWVSRPDRGRPAPLRTFLMSYGKLSSAQIRSVEEEVARLSTPCTKCGKARFRGKPKAKLKGPCPHCQAPRVDNGARRTRRGSKPRLEPASGASAPARSEPSTSSARSSQDAPLVRHVAGESVEDSEAELFGAAESDEERDFHSELTHIPAEPEPPKEAAAAAAAAAAPPPPPSEPKPPPPEPARRPEPRPEGRDLVGKAWRQLKGKNLSANMRQDDEEPVRTLKIGSTIGSYEITNKLGQGGMGVVYLGVHREMRREAAIKVLPVKAEGSRRKLDAFKREAQVLARLDHANIIGIYDVGIDGDYAYIAMELAPHGSVLDKIGKDKRLNHLEATRILLESSRALAKVHAEGLVHRDIKPANILLGGKDEVKLTDFGLVRDEHLDPNKSYFAGKIVGSPAYMSPEQADCRPLDHRTDLYALGVTAYHMLSGHPPFKGKSAVQVLVKQMRESPPRIRDEVPEVPEFLEELILGLMAKNPEARPQSADQLIEALRSKRFVRQKVDKALSINQPLAKVEKSQKLKPSRTLLAPRREQVDLLPAWLQRVAVTVLCLLAALFFFPLDEAIRVYVKGEDQLPLTIYDRAPKDELDRWRQRFETQPISEDSLEVWAQRFSERFSWEPWPARAHSLCAELQRKQRERQHLEHNEALKLARLAFSQQDLRGAAAALSGFEAPTDESFSSFKQTVRDALLSDGWCWVEGDEPFLLQRTEVSREAFAAYVSAYGLDAAPPGYTVPQGTELALPQTGVSYGEAAAYASSYGARLPTVEQWRAAFGHTLYPFGEALQDPASVNARGSYDDQPLPVASELPGGASKLGVLHLSGNAAEWIMTPDGAAAAGGAFKSSPANTTIDDVVPYPEESRSSCIGFRCAVPLR